jgi:transposase
MNRLASSLSNFWNRIQGSLFPFLEEQLDPLTEKQRQLVAVLELIRIETFLADPFHREGRPQKTRSSIARSFVAKMLYNMDSTRALLERLDTDKNLRRICGWESKGFIPSESTFSRAFAEFANNGLPGQVHDALIKETLSKEIISHNSRDSTAIEGWEKPVSKKTKKKNQRDSQEKCLKKRKKGRPKKGEEKAPSEPSRIDKQLNMTLEEMLKDLPQCCDVGAKKDSKGNTWCWIGYKLHLDIIDGCIPVSALLTSASIHDSQVAIPLATITSKKITNLYDLMDSAYDVEGIHQYSKSLGHVPLIDQNPRRNQEMKRELEAEAKAQKTLKWKPPEALRYNERTTVERGNSRLKLELGACTLKVRGHKKVLCHLMFGVLTLAADQLLRLVV